MASLEGPAAADGRIIAIRQALETQTITPNCDIVASPLGSARERDARRRRRWQDRISERILRRRNHPPNDVDEKSWLGSRKRSKSVPSGRPIWKSSTVFAWRPAPVETMLPPSTAIQAWSGMVMLRPTPY